MKIGKTEQQNNSNFIDNINSFNNKDIQESNNKVTTKEQQSNTNKNVNNIYLYLFNKYKRENSKSFSEYLKKVKLLKNDELYNKLDKSEQTNLLSKI